MICVTGNTHGDIKRFNHSALRKLRKGDTLIICGDFGFLWTGKKAEKHKLKWIGKRRYNVVFVDGCHENFDLLEEYELEQWKGGKTRKLYGRLRQLMRGEVYDIDGKIVFAFGGGHSDDMDMRKPGETWWVAERPTEEQIEQGFKNLQTVDNRVDFVVTHEPPERIHEMLNMDMDSQSITCAFLGEVNKIVTFKQWFFGKLHLNKRISPQFCSVFNNVIMADPARYKRDKSGNIKIK